ncbi:MAG: DUF721 domain-containing protein [Fimbriimonadaceae bacterium]
MKRLLSILPGAIGAKQVLRSARAQRALRDWGIIVGPLLATKSVPERFDRGTVWVAVEGSAWAQELRMLEPKILEKLAEVAEDRYLFKEIRFGVRKVKKPMFEAKATQKRFPSRPDLDNLSIREIADQRLKKMRDAADR